MSVLAVVGWDDFQHYKNRDPLWIKLYRDILTTESWVLGTDNSRLVQLASLLLAARYHNAIPLQHTVIKRVANLDMSDRELQKALDHLVATKFLVIQRCPNDSEVVVQPASSVLAQRREEKNREEERREEETMVAARPLVIPTADIEFNLFKSLYPKRNGSNPWPKAKSAINARLAEGIGWPQILDGTRRYAAWCKATQKLNTEHVMQAARFCGPGQEFLLAWDLPASTADMRLTGNLEAAAQAKRELFGSAA